MINPSSSFQWTIVWVGLTAAGIGFAALLFAYLKALLETHVSGRPPSSGEGGEKPSRRGITSAFLLSLLFGIAFVMVGLFIIKTLQRIADTQRDVSAIKQTVQAAAEEQVRCCGLYISFLYRNAANRLRYRRNDILTHKAGGREFKFPPESEVDIPDAVKAVHEHRSFLEKDYNEFREQVELGRKIFMPEQCRRLLDGFEGITTRFRTNIIIRMNPEQPTLLKLQAMHDVAESGLRALAEECEKGPDLE